MAKIICNTVEYLTTENIDGDWIMIQSTGSVEYETNTINEDAGRIKDETVTVRAFTNNTVELNRDSYKFFILRLRTDDGSFEVGSDEFPALLEIWSNGVTDTLTFSRKSA